MLKKAILDPLTLYLCSPRGFCAGVERAIQIVILALKQYGVPVYVRHEIVHNRYVVEGLEARGAIFVEELDEIPETNQPVIFSAHGVPGSVFKSAKQKNLLYLDATCPLVSKVHKQALRHCTLGRQLLLIGHDGHPEVIGTMGQLPLGSVTLIETLEDAENFCPNDENALGYVTQTTLSVEDTATIIDRLKQRFPRLHGPVAESICYATTNRQEAVKNVAAESDHFLILGSPNSSNSCRLVEVALRAGAKRACLVQSADEVPWIEFSGCQKIGLSAGASAPEVLVCEIIETFREHFDLRVELAEWIVENEAFPVVKTLRDTVLDASSMAFVNGT